MTKFDKVFFVIVIATVLLMCTKRVFADIDPTPTFTLRAFCPSEYNHKVIVRGTVNVDKMGVFFKSHSEVALAMQAALASGIRSCDIGPSSGKMQVDVIFFVSGCQLDPKHAGVVGTWILDGKNKPRLVNFKNRAGGPLDFPYFEQAERHERIAIRAEIDRDAFTKRNHIVKLLTIGELKRNPFLFQNQIVGLAVFFAQMQSSDTAVFQEGVGNVITVSGVQAMRFASVRSVALAVRVLGTKQTTTPCGGTTYVLDLQFVDAMECGEDLCRSMFNTKDM